MIKLFCKFCFTLFVFLIISIPVSKAKPITFTINDELKRDNVSFTSDAPIELIVGRTNKITGKITIDDSLNLTKAPTTVSFNVDLSSIDTGIPLRNEHMRDNFLETKKFPTAVFKVIKIMPASPAKLIDQKPLKLMAEGNLSIHGINVKKNIPVKITYFKESDFTHHKFEHGNVIHIQSTFDVPLEEHKIKRPELIWHKLADTVTVSVDAYAISKN